VRLERVAIRACAAFGVCAAERWEHTRRLRREQPICAVGLSVKMTSMHGIALNASTALDYDRLDHAVRHRRSSGHHVALARGSGATIGYDEAKAALLGAAAGCFELEFARAQCDLAGVA
jgi:hypothetical protein